MARPDLKMGLDAGSEPSGDTLDHVLAVLAEAEEGARHCRVEALPEHHPLARLHERLNGLLEALDRERGRSVSYRDLVEDQLATIDLQRARLREISAPIIEIDHGVLCLPLVGSILDDQGEAILDRLLRCVSQQAARHVVLDVTGISALTATTAQWLLRVTAAIRLLGVDCTLTGILPGLATMLASIDLDVDLGGVRTASTVRDALARREAREGGRSRASRRR